ncbi:MAG TPA: hypothetical protein DCM28_01965 [Phycisphaerales bacterium]|nr:hypothetical protein [Phycisphaerales bacterium]HCD32782.1 hypothetical protein [Phycisphaerales bacterium]|tara:strand:+ start:1192 stop:2268 length:1077 start_codon:yes stop_codon:yes gene_type:complete
MARYILLIVCLSLGLFATGCQNKPTANPDPAYELQQSQAQPIATPIPTSTGDQPIVITELSPNDAAALSDGMLDDNPTNAVTVQPKPTKPQVVVIEPDVSHTTPMTSVAQPQIDGSVRAAKGPSDTVMAKRVAQAHGGWHWTRSRSLQTDIKLSFGGKVRLTGTLLTDRAGGKVRLTLTDGTVLVYDGNQVWMSPPDANVARPRFDALTWSYFLVAPFKLNDAGSHLQNLGTLPFMGDRQLAAGKLTFGQGVGDTPDDWYVIYVDPQTRWLRGMAYIVTYGKDVSTAESNPHAITYDNYVKLAGVILPRTWTFWNWSLDKGVIGQPIGSATLSNMQMVYPAANSFIKPENSVLCEAPQ